MRASAGLVVARAVGERAGGGSDRALRSGAEALNRTCRGQRHTSPVRPAAAESAGCTEVYEVSLHAVFKGTKSVKRSVPCSQSGQMRNERPVVEAIGTSGRSSSCSM